MNFLIIDAHTHLGRAYPWASYGGFIPEKGTSAYEFGPEELLEKMNNLGIDKAVIMTMSNWSDNVRDNKEIAEIARRYSDRLVGFALIDPRMRGVERLKRAVEELGIKGLKLHPFAQCYGIYLPYVHPLVEQAIKLKVPVMVHSGTPPHSTPLQIAMLADTFPDATIIMAHMGVSETYAYEARYAAKKYDNIILETSGIPCSYVKRAIDLVGAEKVVFGSDAPWNVIDIELMKLKVLKLPEDEERLVLGENMAKILGIPRTS